MGGVKKKIVKQIYVSKFMDLLLLRVFAIFSVDDILVLSSELVGLIIQYHILYYTAYMFAFLIHNFIPKRTAYILSKLQRSCLVISAVHTIKL